MLATGILVLPSNVYASCGFSDNPGFEYNPINTSEGTTNSLGQPVIGGEAASTRAERECRDERDRQSWYQTLGIATDYKTETLFQGVTDSFTAGGSVIFNVAASYQRAFDNPVDPNFEPRRWLDENREKYQIEMQYLSSFAGTGSEAEARALLADVSERKAAQARVQRMGAVAQFTVSAIAALPDIAIVLCSLTALSIPVRSAFRRSGKRERATARI